MAPLSSWVKQWKSNNGYSTLLGFLGFWTCPALSGPNRKQLRRKHENSCQLQQAIFNPWKTKALISTMGTLTVWSRYAHGQLRVWSQITVCSRYDHGQLTDAHGTIIVRSRYIHDTITVRSWYSHGAITVSSRYAYGRSRPAHGMLAVDHGQLTVRSLSDHGILTLGSQSAHGMFMVLSRPAHGMFTVRSRSTRSQGKYSWPVFRYIYSYQRS
jgi:hypothetical protein